MTPDLLAFVRVLSGGGVDYIIVGGVAAGIHGALRTTLDLDVVYSRVRAMSPALLPPSNPFSPTCAAHRPGSPSDSTLRPCSAA